MIEGIRDTMEKEKALSHTEGTAEKREKRGGEREERKRGRELNHWNVRYRDKRHNGKRR